MWVRTRQDDAVRPINMLRPLAEYFDRCYVPVARFALADLLERRDENQDCFASR